MTQLYPKKELNQEQPMKTPRKATLNFLRNFAHAYTVSATVGAMILN